MAVAAGLGVLVFVGSESFPVVKRTVDAAEQMKIMADEGMNFTAYYRHPDVADLTRTVAAGDLPVRVATVQSNGPDNSPSIPCCWPRQGSVFGTFLAGQGLETADAYLSNVPLRYVEYWNLMITGHTGMPRADFVAVYSKQYKLPEQAYTQKLYLFEPIEGTVMMDTGCIEATDTLRFGSYYDLDLLSLANVGYVVSTVPIAEPRLTLLPSATRDTLARSQCADWAVKRDLMHETGLTGRPLYIYRNEDVLPRVFSPDRLETVADRPTLFAQLLSRPLSSLRHTALALAAEVPEEVRSGTATDPLEIRSAAVDGDRITVTRNDTAAGFLVVSNSYSPFWRARFKGRDIPVFPVYHAFLGIAVPAGRATSSCPMSRTISGWGCPESNMIPGARRPRGRKERRMIRTNLTADDFADLFGTDVGALPRSCLERIAAGGFDYEILAGEERDAVILGFLKRIEKREFSMVVEGDKSRWIRGWSENLDGFVQSKATRRR
ncbi:MAG: hypothetical protein HC900_05920 [Methylacidiphilales bacterium]|nr:hypothetical protein [Candidatus Methylacidiphilales bacterium]